MAQDNNSNKLYRNFRATSFAVDNATSILLLTFMIILFGIQSYQTMPKEQFPEIVIPTIYVGTTYAGNSAEDMESLVTTKLEKEIASINGIKKLESTSISDFSNVIVEFNTDVTVEKALQEVKDAVDKAKGDKDFPTNDLTAGPDVFEINFSELPIMTVNLSGQFQEDELRAYGEYLQDEIEKLPEISEVKLKGISSREIRIDADWASMQSRKISFDDIMNALMQENITMSAGERQTNGFKRSVRVVGEFKTVADIQNVVIKSEFQNVIFLKDVAKVYEGFEDPTSIARSDGNPVVSLDVIKRSGENLLSAADKIKEITDRAQEKRFPEDLKVSLFNDQSDNTRKQVADLQNSIISGVILVVLVLLFFLGFRNSLFVGLAIPLSMLMGILILNVMGITLNVVVLFSLILALGLLVDNSIVVVENIYRYMQGGYSPKDAAKKAAGEVAMPIISSTATTLAAFVPLMFWPGLMGEFMKYLPLTLIIVLASSLFVALVITPVFTSTMMVVDNEASLNARDRKKVRRRQLINNLIWAGVLLALTLMSMAGGNTTMRNIFGMTFIAIVANILILRPGARFFQNILLPVLENLYDKFIGFALKGIMPIIFFAGTVGLLFFSMALLGSNPPKVIGFPSSDPLYVNAFIDLPIGSDIQSTNELMRELEQKVADVIRPYQDGGAKIPEGKSGIVDAVLSQIGENTSDPSGPPEPGATPNKARLTVSFVSADKRHGLSTYDVMEEIRASLTGYAGVELVIDRNAEGPPTGKPINIEISGADVSMKELSLVADEVLAYLKAATVPGVEELKMNIVPDVQQDEVRIDKEAAGRYGLRTGMIGNTLRMSLNGVEAGNLKRGDEEYPIILRYAEEYRNDKDKLLNQMISFRNMDAGGQITQIPISAVARVSSTTTYNAIKRKNEKRTITIYSNILKDYNPNEVVDELKAAMEEYNFESDDYSYKFTGQQEEQAEDLEFLSSAFLVALFAIFLILVTQFNSVSAPVIIILSILFSTIGVLFGYVFTGRDFVIVMTGIGIISLAGIVVNNAIVLIDYTMFLQKQRLEEYGKAVLSDREVKESIMEGGRTRLRPVLLTAITTILGLVPLAIGFNFDFGTFITDLDPNIFVGGDNAAIWGPMAWTVIYGLTFATFLTLVIVPVMYWMFYKLGRMFAGLIGMFKRN